MTIDLEALAADRGRIVATYLRDKPARSPSSARGVHHVALISADVERTVRFYQDVLEFPLTEVLGGLHHLAISVEPVRWERLKANLDAAGVEYAHVDEVSLYFRDPDGARLELIADPLGEMYGKAVV